MPFPWVNEEAAAIGRGIEDANCPQAESASMDKTINKFLSEIQQPYSLISKVNESSS